MTEWETVLQFWADAGPEKWFAKDDDFDAALVENFTHLNEAAHQGKLDDWQGKPDSCLALIILLDQFSRNLFRGSAKAFSRDKKALQLANFSLTNAYDKKMPEEMYFFSHMPFMHSESILDQKTSLGLMHACDVKGALEAAIFHYEIIKRFGRFPHRNTVFGRHTTPAEKAYLDHGGFQG